MAGSSSAVTSGLVLRMVIVFCMAFYIVDCGCHAVVKKA
jgi:preprotein translocase subunit SecE